MSIAAASVVALLFLIGLIGTVLPVLPGTLIAFSGVLVHKVWMGDASVSWGFVALCAVLAAASFVLDFACTWWGAKRYGATARGALGAVLGGIAGMILLTPLLGLLIGPFVGALLFELMDGRSRPDALRAGWGTVLGNIAALFAKMACTLGIIGGFVLLS